MKQKILFLLLAFAGFLPRAFAQITDPCFGSTGPTDMLQAVYCISQTALFGIDIAVVIFLGVIVYVMFKYNVPSTVAIPAFFVFFSIMLGVSILHTGFSFMFFIGLIVLALFITIALLRLFR